MLEFSLKKAHVLSAAFVWDKRAQHAPRHTAHGWYRSAPSTLQAVHQYMQLSLSIPRLRCGSVSDLPTFYAAHLIIGLRSELDKVPVLT